MKDLLEYLVKNIVEQPEAVKVVAAETPEGFVNFQLTVAPEDMGMVIGKGGRIIRALRNLVRVKAIKEGKRVNVELVENQSQMANVKTQNHILNVKTDEEI
jgi:predicted RNA-binding protein YlqC (UPF0109 family)